MKYKFFYSEQQRMGDCCNLIETPDGNKEYTEMRSDGTNSNWDDAVLVYETDGEYKITFISCGTCFRCDIFSMTDNLNIEDDINESKGD